MKTPMFCRTIRIIRTQAGKTFQDVATLAEAHPLDIEAVEAGTLPPTQEILRAYDQLARRRQR